MELVLAPLCGIFRFCRERQPVVLSKLVGLVYFSRLSLACGESHCCSSRRWHCCDIRCPIAPLTVEEESKLGLGRVRLFSFQGDPAALSDEEIRNWVCGSECHGDMVSLFWGVSKKKWVLRTKAVAIPRLALWLARQHALLFRLKDLLWNSLPDGEICILNCGILLQSDIVSFSSRLAPTRKLQFQFFL